MAVNVACASRGARLCVCVFGVFPTWFDEGVRRTISDDSTPLRMSIGHCISRIGTLKK